MYLEVIDDEEQFRGLREEWDRLLAVSRQDGPCLTHLWLSTWWDTHKPSGRLHVVTCRDDDRLLGVLPTFSARMGRLVSVPAGRLLGDRGVGSVGLGPFALPDAEEEVFDLFAEYVLRGKHGWGVLDLDFVHMSQPFLSRFQGMPFVKDEGTSGVCPRVTLGDGWDSYLASLSQGRRKKIGQWRRKLESIGVDLEVIDEPDALADAVEDLFDIMEQRMRAKEPDYEASDEYREFVTRVARSLLDDERLLLMFLKRESERVAVAYHLKYGETMYGQLLAFKPVKGTTNLTRPLLSYALQATSERGCSIYDFMLGDQDYKFEWGDTEVREFSRVQVYGTSLRACARRARDTFVNRRTGTTGPS
jgi:CelD/BcsL family acetyltransferase involved in cellulose biosynthesis